MKISALALAVTAALAANSAEALLIDSFKSGALAPPGIWATGPSGSNSGSQFGSMMGKRRTIDLLMLSGGSETYVTVVTSPGALVINNGDTETSTVSVIWDTTWNPADPDLKPVDLTDAGTAVGFYLTLPAAIDHRLDVVFTVTSLTGISTASRQFASGTKGDNFDIPFALFTGNANLSQATAVKLELSSPDVANDARITMVETRVPIPGTLLLMGVGLAGLVRSIRRAARR